MAIGKIIRQLLATVIVLVPCVVNAADDKFSEVKAQIATCMVCHGDGGASIIPQNPILAGQHLYYIYTQLKDFKAGLRASEIMQPLVANLEKEQMLLIAEYFSKQPWPKVKRNATAGQEQEGRKVVTAGQCVQCHLGGFEGSSGVPRVAGQHPEYIEKTMLDFKNKLRLNSAAKNSLMKDFSDEQIKAATAYITSK
ncbi:MAG: c-type cytochrome [Candidatus Porifericomitaceae bacterium WSBS_2022_MAG_OTU9]